MNASQTRIERDSMGEVEVPASAYYGASTQRAVDNFPISQLRLPRAFIRGLGLIKLAAARVNWDLSLLEPEVAAAIEAASQEVAQGDWDSHFVVDVFQSGSGTSTNMNANEVIGRRAQELLPGDSQRIHPNDHVNLCQSSNDVIPSAIRIAALASIESELLPALAALQRPLEAKSREFWDVIKTGRTHLQDATPIRLGQEFLGYAGQVERAIQRFEAVRQELGELPLGGTAVGTGINCHPAFPRRAIAALAQLTGLSLRETDNHFATQNNTDAFVAASGAVRSAALALMKVAEDVRWLGSGPRAGLGELELPAVQPGSSIMPGKVNPVICESVLQVCAQVVGYDAAIVAAAQNSHFELNMALPLTAYDLLQSISLLANAAQSFRERCIEGLRATGRGPELVERGLAIATALAPRIGYDAAAQIAREASETGESIFDVALRRAALSEPELRQVLDATRLTEPGLE